MVDVGGAKPSDQDASYVIGMGLMQALAHAAPDVSPDKYPQLGERYKFHYSQSMNDITPVRRHFGTAGRPESAQPYLDRGHR